MDIGAAWAFFFYNIFTEFFSPSSSMTLSGWDGGRTAGGQLQTSVHIIQAGVYGKQDGQSPNFMTDQGSGFFLFCFSFHLGGGRLSLLAN